MKKFALFFTILLLFCSNLFGSDKKVKIDNMKTAYIFNFAKFITCDNSKSKVFNICTYLDNPYHGSLFKLNQKSVKGKKILVSHASSKEEIQNCQMLILPSMDDEKLIDVIEWAKEHNIITISGTKGYGEKGVIINFFTKDKKVRFEINNEQASLSNITISSKLLRVAKLVGLSYE